MYNTIILKKGEATLSNSEFKYFDRGDTIYGVDSLPEELKRWSIEDRKSAQDELDSYRCSYRHYSDCVDVVEYALEYCECDEDGNFLSGSDYDIADEEEE